MAQGADEGRFRRLVGLLPAGLRGGVRGRVGPVIAHWRALRGRVSVSVGARALVQPGAWGSSEDREPVGAVRGKRACLHPI